MSEEIELNWFAMSATYSRELKMKQILDSLDIESFVPMRTVTIPPKNGLKKQKKIVPAIKNLIFIRSDKQTIQNLKEKHLFLQYKIHHSGGKKVPIIVPYDQMNKFIAITNGVEQDEIEFINYDEIKFETGEKVEIVAEGYLKGQIGIYVRVKGRRDKRVVIAVEGAIAVVFTTLKSIDIKRIKL